MCKFPSMCKVSILLTASNRPSSDNHCFLAAASAFEEVILIFELALSLLSKSLCKLEFYTAANVC